jgi:hypothetical protein
MPESRTAGARESSYTWPGQGNLAELLAAGTGGAARRQWMKD